MKHLYKTLEDVKSYFQFENYLITTSQSINIYDHSNFIRSYNENVYCSMLFSNFLLFQNTNGKEVKYLDLFDKNFKVHTLCLKENFYLFRYTILENNLLIKNTNGEICEFDNKLIKKKNTLVSRYSKFITAEKYLNIEGKSLLKKSLKTGETLWQKEFVTDITKLEVWNETVVLVELSAQFMNQIIALDAATGTILWEKEGARMQLLTNELYFLEHTQTRFFIKKFDLGKNELFEYNIIENVKTQFGNALPSFSYTIKEHLAYLSFTSEKVVMIINLNTLNTEWSHQLETEAWQIYEPRVEGVRLYVLDSDKTLHIFENE